MSEHLSLAIVGCGDIANFMAIVARLTPRVRLTAACDISKGQVDGFGRRHRIRSTFTAYDEMLATGGFDVVYLAVPHHLHYGMMESAIDAGYQIFAEKPITRTFAEGRKIAAYAKQKGIKLGVNYQYRYDSGCYKLARAVQSGVLGKVQNVRINVPWHRTEAYFENSPWHKSIAHAGGGTLITQASHLIDVVLWAAGSPPVSTFGQIDQKIFKDVEVEDFAAGEVLLENGAIIQITSSMAAATEQPVSIEVYCEKSTAVYTNSPWPKVRFFGKKPETVKLPQAGVHALQRSLKGFRDWVLYDEPYLIPAEEAIPVLKVVESIYQSAATGTQVNLRD